MLKKTALIGSAVLALLLAACQIPGVGNPAPSSTGLTLHWSTGKTILPDAAGVTPESYDITLTGADGTVLTKHLTANSATFPSLAYIPWTVEVNANVTLGGVSTVVATGSTTVDLSFEHNRTAQVSLHYVTKGAGNGAIHLTLDIAPPNGDAVVARILVLTKPLYNATDNSVDYTTEVITLSDPAFVLDPAPIGNYNAFFLIKTANNSAMAQESVVVGRGFDTKGTVSFPAEAFGVQYVPVSAISLPAFPTGGTPLHYAQPVKLPVTFSPSNASNTFVTWTSSDNTVATVGPDGLVTAGLKTGSATITATSADNNAATATWECTVAPDPGIVSAMVTEGRNALGAKDWNKARSAFLQAIANNPDDNDARIWSSLIDLTALTVHPEVVDLMRARLGVVDYPTDLNTLFSDTWFNAKFYEPRSGFVETSSPTNGGPLAIRGNLVPVDSGQGGGGYSLVDSQSGYTKGGGDMTKKFVPDPNGTEYATHWNSQVSTEAAGYLAANGGKGYSFYQKSDLIAGGNLVRGRVETLTGDQYGQVYGLENTGTTVQWSQKSGKFVPDTNGTFYANGWFFNNKTTGENVNYRSFDYLKANPSVVGYTADNFNGPTTLVAGGNLVRGTLNGTSGGNAFLYQSNGAFMGTTGVFNPDPNGNAFASNWSFDSAPGVMNKATEYLASNPGVVGYSQIMRDTPIEGGNMVRGKVASPTMASDGWVNGQYGDGNPVNGHMVFTPDPTGDVYAFNWNLNDNQGSWSLTNAVDYLKANPSVTGYSQTWNGSANIVVPNGNFVRGKVAPSTTMNVKGWVSGKNPDGSDLNLDGVFTPDPAGSVYARGWSLSTDWNAYDYAQSTGTKTWGFSKNLLDITKPHLFPNIAAVEGFQPKDDSANETNFTGYGIEDWARLLALNVLNRNPAGLNGVVDQVLSKPLGDSLDSILGRLASVPDNYRTVVPATLLNQIPTKDPLPVISIGKPELLLIAADLKTTRAFLQYISSVDLSYPVPATVLFQLANSKDFVDANMNGINDPMEALYGANPGLYNAPTLKERGTAAEAAAKRAASKATFLSALADLQTALTQYQGALADSGSFYRTTIASLFGSAKDDAGNPIDVAAMAQSGVGNAKTAVGKIIVAVTDNSSLIVPLLKDPDVLLGSSFVWPTAEATDGSTITVNPGAFWNVNAFDLRKWVVTDAKGFQVWLISQQDQGDSMSKMSTTPMILPTNRGSITALTLGIDTSVTKGPSKKFLKLAPALKLSQAWAQQFYPAAPADLGYLPFGPGWEIVTSLPPAPNSGSSDWTYVYGPYKPDAEAEMYLAWINR